MSIPENILDKYRSHSIHYILAVSNTSESIRKFCSPGSASEAQFLSSISGKQLGEDIGGNTYLLVDSRRTSEFSIKSLTFSSQPIGNTSPEAVPLLDSLIEMDIVDPSGIGFFNYFKYLVDVKLQTDFVGMKFLLYIEFIGHTFDGKTEKVDGLFLPMHMGGTFALTSYTTTGGTYHITFCLLSGLNSGKETMLLTNQFNININIKDSLLGNAIDEYEKQLNLKFKDIFEKANYYSDDTQTAGQVQSNSTQQGSKKGRLIQYMITIPEEWKNFKVAFSPSQVKEINFSTDGKAHLVDEAAQTGRQASASYTTAINNDIRAELLEIVSGSPDVCKLGAEEAKKAGKAIIPKITTSVTSDENSLTYHLDVIAFEVPNVNAEKQVVTESSNNGLPKRTDSPEGGFIYDFIFSGKNSDILDLDIKFDNLLPGLFSKPGIAISAKEERITAGQNKPIDNPNTSNEKVSKVQVGQYQPIGVPPITQSQRQNLVEWANRNDINFQQHFNDKQELHKTLSDLAVCSVQPLMKIRGNPDLLRNFTTDSVFEHSKVSENTVENSSVKQKHRQAVEKLAESKRFLKVGQYMKVNIFGPRDYPFSQEEGIGHIYRTQLFYDGWYMVLGIVNHFEGANFTQEISLRALDLYGVFNAEKSLSASTTAQQPSS